jgi:hypothetical protein
VRPSLRSLRKNRKLNVVSTYADSATAALTGTVPGYQSHGSVRSGVMPLIACR